MVILKVIVLWAALYSVLALILFALVGTDYPTLTIATLDGILLLSLLLTWIFKPVLVHGRSRWPETNKKLQRLLLALGGPLMIGVVVVLWVIVVRAAALLLGRPDWQLLVFTHGVGGLAFLALLKRVPPDKNNLTFEDGGHLDAYKVWSKQLRKAWAQENYEQILELLRDNDPQTIAQYLFWLEQDEVEVAHRTIQFIEDAPFVRMLVAPLRACTLPPKSENSQHWEQWVKTYGLYEKMVETSYRKRLGYSFKRLIDFLVATLAFFGPLLPLVWLITGFLAWRFGSIRRVFFISLRVGTSKSLFHHYQFRTIRAVEDGSIIVSRIGNLLIWTGLDQLPALWNVITGEMSLVGPHPMYPSYLIWRAKEGKHIFEKLKVIVSVRPGLIDPALANALSRPKLYRCLEDCLQIHYRYVMNWSLLQDPGIVFIALLFYLGFRVPNGLLSFIHNLQSLPPVTEVFLPVPTFLRSQEYRHISSLDGD